MGPRSTFAFKLSGSSIHEIDELYPASFRHFIFYLAQILYLFLARTVAISKVTRKLVRTSSDSMD